ncbi:MAG TPA: multiubiquitin domain-containing protein [Acidobacteriaceae bacterium]
MTAANTVTGLHIFVNRRKFEEGDGVRPEMTGAEIAALVGVPKDNAVVRKDSGPDQNPIGVDERIEVKNGDHFLVTRKVVEGGHVERAH